MTGSSGLLPQSSAVDASDPEVQPCPPEITASTAWFRIAPVAERRTVIRNLIDAQSAPAPGAIGFLSRVCQAATSALSASGSGVSVFTDETVRGVSAASDPRTARIEELQFVLGEGPCVDAFDSGRPVLIAELTGEAVSRWPMYTPAVRASGVRAVFAFPLQVGAARLGVLDVFRDRSGALSEDQLIDALVFADVTVTALLDGQAEDGSTTDGIVEAVGYRAEVFQAQGMVMVQIEGSITDAMARMRAYAYAENRSLSEIARDVVAGRLSFEQDRP